MCQNLNIFCKCQKHSLYAHARQSLLLLTQGNIYNRLRFLNKYLMFLEELNELFRENWSKFLTAGYLVFWQQFLAAGFLDSSINSSENTFVYVPIATLYSDHIYTFRKYIYNICGTNWLFCETIALLIGTIWLLTIWPWNEMTGYPVVRIKSL